MTIDGDRPLLENREGPGGNCQFDNWRGFVRNLDTRSHSKWFDNNVVNQKHQKRRYEKITHFIDP
jgi:hypothetical protein